MVKFYLYEESMMDADRVHYSLLMPMNTSTLKVTPSGFHGMTTP